MIARKGIGAEAEATEERISKRLAPARVKRADVEGFGCPRTTWPHHVCVIIPDARVGCDVVASDLNPVAAMLTWGALNIIGADEGTRTSIAEEQKRIAQEVEKFRADMVAAFRAMADHMPDNGLQICMFTHQDAGVLADMAQVVWGAGLRVTAAWYVSTETASDLKNGGYVQGTVLLVLRKRLGDERAYKDELVLELRGAVQQQVDLLTGLNQIAKSRQRDENPFSDADVQMAGYAAALKVLTGFTHIEGVDMTREALRLAPTERFWLKMTEAEANRPMGQPTGKLDDYQNFAKAYRADEWKELMADSTPNKARPKAAADFKRGMMTGHPFAAGLVRPALYAVNELSTAAEREDDHNMSAERAISGLRDNLASWALQRQQAMVLADWMGRMLDRHHPSEASAARTLASLIRNERLG